RDRCRTPDRRRRPAEKISVRNLDFFYDGYRALKSISLPLYDRQVTAFIGPSGCGKSTLLRILNRMYDLYPKQVATGEVLLDGHNILSPKQDLTCCAPASAWCSRSRRLSRCRSTTTSPSA
ncbi:ATP-binding cassette domain-containing protein, partial [Azospirillum oryzae]|uniref:ATP-binding cassette domain-containing protein n=1 Tax=Azospirillum oryzae TaxID=286727 RepID=UPI003D77ECDA